MSVSLLPFFVSFQYMYSSGGGGNRPYSSLASGYDPLADSLGMDNSRSYLGGGMDGMGNHPTAAELSDESSRNRYLASRRFVVVAQGNTNLALNCYSF